MKEKDCIKSVEGFDKTGFYHTNSQISGKYKLTGLYAIYRYKVIRFNELQRYLNMISHKTLSNTIKEFFKRRYPNLGVTDKIPVPKPVNQWLKPYGGGENGKTSADKLFPSSFNKYVGEKAI